MAKNFFEIGRLGRSQPTAIDYSEGLQPALDDLEAKKAEGFFTNRMGELETKLREQIRDILKSTNHNVDMGWHDDYQSYIKSVLISVCAPGWCEGSLRHLETLNVGALMLAHDCINDCQLVPNVDLIDGEDYVSFNLDNLSEKLDYLMNNRKEIDRIRLNGQKKFIQAYDYEISADKLNKYIETL